MFYLMLMSGLWKRITVCMHSASLGQVYEQHQDEDGFLYVAYSSETTFGWCATRDHTRWIWTVYSYAWYGFYGCVYTAYYSRSGIYRVCTLMSLILLNFPQFCFPCVFKWPSWTSNSFLVDSSLCAVLIWDVYKAFPISGWSCAILMHLILA